MQNRRSIIATPPPVLARALTLFLAFSSIPALLCPASLVTITRPSSGTVSVAEQVVEGRVELASIERLSLSVEPFLHAAGRAASSRTVLLQSGRFHEQVTLSPGLNIITLSSLGGGHRTGRAVYLASGKPGSKKPLEEWGADSPVALSSPVDLKTAQEEVRLVGTLKDAGVEGLDIVVLDTYDFFAAAGQREEGITYRRVAVKDLRFSVALKLGTGLNIILVKAAGRKASEADILVKSLIYEAASARLVLDEPLVERGRLVVTGRVIDASRGVVKVSVECLVEEELRPGKISPKTIIRREVKVAADGRFRLEERLKLERYTIKSAPSITVSAGDAVATKTLVVWR